MGKPELIIIGASEHAKVVIDIFEKSDSYKLIGLIDTFKPTGFEVADNYVLGDEHSISALLNQYPDLHYFIAIGDNWVRAQVYEKIQLLFPDLPLATAIHPSAQIAKHVRIGAGTVIMAGAIINSDTTIGIGCIVNTKASIDHDGNMGNFSSLAPGATLGGKVQVGNYTAISIGGIIKHGITIGEHSVIGAGALVLKDVNSCCVAYGTPAVAVRTRTIGEPYL